MSVNKTAYETTACAGYGPGLKRITEELQKLLINGGLFVLGSESEHIPVNQNIYCVRAYTAIGDAVPAFIHPIIIQDEKNKTDICVVDQRTCTRYNAQQDQLIVSNTYEYNFNALRAHLTYLWDTGDREVFLNVAKPAVAAYSRWISENLTRRFSLDPNDQFTLSVLAAFFFICQFYDDEQFVKEDKQKMAMFISRCVYCAADQVLDLIEPLENIKNIDEFCVVCREVTGNIRLEDLSTAIIFAVIGGGWFGVRGQEILCAAAEHPPTWLAIIQAAYNDRSYKSTVIGKLVQRDKPDVIKTYTHGIFTLLRA